MVGGVDAVRAELSRPRHRPRPHAARAAGTSAARAVVAGVALTVAAAACGGAARDGAAAAPPRDTVVVVSTPAPDSTVARVLADTAGRGRAGYVVDSARSVEEELAAFRAGLAPVAGLAGAAPSREALAERVLGALARRDTAALARLALTRAEFAWLVYPDSRYTRPPFRQPPGLVWLQVQRGGGLTALHRLVQKAGGARRTLVGVACDPTPEPSGAARLWRGCRVTAAGAQGDTLRARLFGVVVEHGGRFKVANYATEY